MVVKIVETEKNGKVFKNLKMSNMLPFEYVIIEKSFPDPKTGTSQYGNWYNYGVYVTEYVTVDPNTGERVEKEFDEPEQVSFFARETIHEKIKNIPVNTPILIRQEKKEGDQFSRYVIEELEKVVDNPTKNNVAPEIPMNEKIKEYKKNGVALEEVLTLIKKQYDNASDDLIKQVYESS